MADVLFIKTAWQLNHGLPILIQNYLKRRSCTQSCNGESCYDNGIVFIVVLIGVLLLAGIEWLVCSLLEYWHVIVLFVDPLVVLCRNVYSVRYLRSLRCEFRTAFPCLEYLIVSLNIVYRDLLWKRRAETAANVFKWNVRLRIGLCFLPVHQTAPSDFYHRKPCFASSSRAVFLNRRAAARYRALASIILGHERPEETTLCYKISLVQLITN
jgi:hypothetical protein